MAVICPPSQGQTWLPHGPNSNYHFFSRGGVGRRSRSYCTFSSPKTKTNAFTVRGCGQDSVEDHHFVKALRESQPYISVHRGRLFVLLISAQLVAGPYFNPILKVNYHLPTSLSLSLSISFSFTEANQILKITITCTMPSRSKLTNFLTIFTNYYKFLSLDVRL